MKNRQRNELLKRRGALNRSFIRRKSALISKKLYSLLKRRGFSSVASYSPYNNEVDPNIYLDSRSLYFPKVESIESRTMSFFRGPLVRSFKGIKEPKVFKRKAFRKNFEAIVVPGVGFDERGYRIGYGAGFYDRFLKDLRAFKVGVAFECCVVGRVENTENDISVDVVITEKREIHCRLRR